MPRETGVVVSRGMTHDGLGEYLSQIITKASPPTDDVVKIFKDTNTHVLINYLPSAARWLPSGTWSAPSMPAAP